MVVNLRWVNLRASGRIILIRNPNYKLTEIMKTNYKSTISLTVALLGAIALASCDGMGNSSSSGGQPFPMHGGNPPGHNGR